MTRRAGFRVDEPQAARTTESAPHWSPQMRPWNDVPGMARVARISRLLDLIKERRPAVEDAVRQWKGDEASQWTTRMLETAQAMLSCAPEVLKQQPTVAVPGQMNFLLWDTPRGVGIAAADAGSAPASLFGLVFGPLLAANGVTVASSDPVYETARLLVATAHEVGIPAQVVGLAPKDVSALALAAGPIQFAAVDLPIAQSRALYRALGHTSDTGDQRYLKALVSLSEGALPGEPGFLRRFVHAKTVAVRTLRHGAELELG